MIFRKSILLLAIIFLLLFSNLAAQNLVRNFSFELFGENFYNKEESKSFPQYWKPANLESTIDFYKHTRELFKFKSHNPEKIKPSDGNCFIGMHLRYGNRSEYVQNTLVETLKKDQLYCCSFDIILSENAKYALFNIGLLFTTVSETNICEPQLYNKEDDLITNQSKWRKLCWLYKADGTERNIVIGTFKNPNQIKIVKITDKPNPKAKWNLDKNGSAYYLIDNVSVVSIADTLHCNCDEIIIMNNLFNNTLSPHSPVIKKSISK